MLDYELTVSSVFNEIGFPAKFGSAVSLKQTLEITYYAMAISKQEGN
jgi:hypothetical protein